MLSSYHSFRTLIDARVSEASPQLRGSPVHVEKKGECDERVCEIEDASGDENEMSSTRFETQHVIISTVQRRALQGEETRMDEDALLQRAEKKFVLGKFLEASSDCSRVEDMYLKKKQQQHMEELARVRLLHGKCQFKLGNIKKAHSLLAASSAIASSQEAEELLKEVDKMMYFESLLDWSMSNPLFSNNESPFALPQHELMVGASAHSASQQDSNRAVNVQQDASRVVNVQQDSGRVVSAAESSSNNNNNTLNASLRSLPVLCPKLTSEHKYEPDKSDAMCWQNVFLRHTKKNGIVKVK